MLDHPDQVLIQAPEQFRFAWGSEFRRQYQAGGATTRYVLDLGETRELDTAALGMLRQLVERAGSDPRRLAIRNAPSALLDLLEIAGLQPYLSRP